MKLASNKRGNLPIILLVLGILAVCSLALLSFYFANLKMSNNFSGVALLEELNAQIEYNSYNELAVEGLRKTQSIRTFNFKNGFFKRKIIFSVVYNP